MSARSDIYPVPEFPDYVHVELTNVCNARCTVCATPNMQRPRRIMDPELFRKIVEECARRRPRWLLPFLHGESLLVPGVLDYFRTARELAPDTRLNLTTNASKLSPEISEAVLKEGLLDHLIVSVDGGDKATFEATRLGLNYDEVRSNVLYFLHRRAELGLKQPKVSVAMVTTAENKATRRRLAEAWREADEVRFSVYFNWAGRLDGECRPSNKINFCERLYHYLTILVDGRVAMCCFDSEGEQVVGDVRRMSLHEVWHSDVFQAKRRALYRKQFERLPLCARCDYLNHPAWATPLLRRRPAWEHSWPRLTGWAGRAYKRWLTR
ncbi:MAG TPA: SPASM domain-containing protein [Acidobacteriota bacterium]|nr:SPASM domain-containing protein [Acidobacteriota bacterium]HRV08518.1 SPASM domain-containing protein [Acidobacteriota bacterium]